MISKLISKTLFQAIILLTGFFCLLEISFFIQCNRSYFTVFTFVSEKLSIPYSVLPPIIYFIFVQLSIHFFYCCLIWAITLIAAYSLNIQPHKLFSLGLFLWAAGIVSILIANQAFFPYSKFSELMRILLPQPAAKPLSVILLCAWALMFLVLCMLSCQRRLASSFSQNYWMPAGVYPGMFLAGAGMTACLITLFFLHPPTPPPTTTSTTRPNIIIVGVDSLRPDFLNFFGKDIATPFMNSFLRQSTVFSEAFTPLARTFPSWVGILTGKYPKQIGVRSNLEEQTHLDLSDTLPKQLRQQGYTTVYASDETRFSNISKNFGFDKIVTPPMGLNDFLLGTFNDFPLSNFLINTSLGKWLFPYSYANRAAYFSYYPNTFLNLLKPTLEQLHSKPLFLAIHFCLPHHPYLWADAPIEDKHVQRYVKSIERADTQLGDFFALLNQAHLLDHAIVVLLSDHGEALELPGDRITDPHLFVEKGRAAPHFYPSSLDDEQINQSAGHGTDVLGLPQYHALLAFRFYGVPTPPPPAVVPGVVSLLDIKPTISAFASSPHISIASSLHVPVASSPHALSGDLRIFQNVGWISRAKRGVIHQYVAKKSRHLFLESDFSPEAVRTVYPETRKVVLEGAEIFQIDPHTTRLTVKPAMRNMIIHSKQFADIYAGWMLALYPQGNHQRFSILVDLKTGKWTDNLHSDFAKHSPAITMMAALREFYGEELE